MASPESPDPLVEEPSSSLDRERFENTLRNFAAERGIAVDFGTRVAGKDIDLYTLYQIVKSRGGYDAVSAEKLAWRKIGVDFQLGATNAAAYAFALKTAYYKNLAAYEIRYMHGRDPPPVEILEALTAKGSNILNRTVENFKAFPARTGHPDDASDSDENEATTPKEEKMDLDDSATSGGRGTRGLRQQPPQRVFFQPEVSSTRNARSSSGYGQSPQPSAPIGSSAGFSYSVPNPGGTNLSVANYEPQMPMPMNLRPVLTPGNNYPAFKANIERARDANRVALGLDSPSAQGIMKPGQGYEGPNIYVRILQGLQCPLPDEQDYALHHLVKISHERGDKYKFEAFPGLAEGLVEYMLKIGAIFYDIDWKIGYTEDENDINILDGINGTPDIVQRINSLERIDSLDEVESPKRTRDISKVSEATLTVRNLALLEENAFYLSEMPQLRDWLSIALNLPSVPHVVEIKHYALDISEQVVRYWKMDITDPLYQSLIRVVERGHDRGAIISALKALTRLSLSLEEPNRLEGMTTTFLRRLFDWTFLEDEELTSVSLEFFYQYTANPVNIDFLLSHENDLLLSPFIVHLSRLLQHRSVTSQVKIAISKSIAATSANEIPRVPPDMMDEFLQFSEPDRSNRWLRAVFEEDEPSSITQIALWQAYQSCFSEHNTANIGLLPAAEFIKNVSTIFAGANAQVINEPVQKFIIKGIRPRHAPVDSKGRIPTRCLWRIPGAKQCGSFQLKSSNMFEHVLSDHMGLKRNPDGKWNINSPGNRPTHNDCYWGNCRHFAKSHEPSPSAFALGMHVKTHLPDCSNKSSFRQRHNRTPANKTLTEDPQTPYPADGLPNYDPEQGKEATYKYMTFHNTQTDEYNNPAGLPFSSWLVLRNFLRNIPRAISLSQSGDVDPIRRKWMESLLLPIKPRLIDAMTHNRTLTRHISDLLNLLDKGLA